MAPTKILAIKLRSLGDTVLMTAPLIELSKAFPQSKIHVVVSSPWTSLMEGFPGIERVWPYERRNEKASRARTLARMAFQLRKEKFDLAINFHASPSSATLAFASGAKTRSIHFHGHKDRNRYSTVVVPGKGILKPIIERDMDALRALGLHVPAGRSPQLPLPPSEVLEGKALLKKLDLPAPLLGISLGAGRPTKSWPVERFASLAVEWFHKTKGGVLALAGPAEGLSVQNFLKSVDDHLFATVEDSVGRSQIRSRIAATHQLSLRNLAAVLTQVSVLAGNDSGPRHLAVSVNTPTVTLFGPEHPFEWHPYPPERHPFFFVENLPCRRDAAPGMPPWCGIEECVIEEHKCMRMIGTDSVLSACQKVARL